MYFLILVNTALAQNLGPISSLSQLSLTPRGAEQPNNNLCRGGKSQTGRQLHADSLVVFINYQIEIYNKQK